MQKELSEAVREQLAASRQRALAEADTRQRQIYAACPGLYDLDREMAKAAMEIASAAMSENGAAQVERIKEQIMVLQGKRNELMGSMGYTPESLQPQFRCMLCQDTGFASGKRCACWQELYRVETAKRLPSAALSGQCSFESFSLDYYPLRDEAGGTPRQTMERIARSCMEYAERVGEGAGSLLFMGKTGLGKTHLSLAIAARAAERGCLVKYSSAQGIIDRYERTRFNRNPTPDDWEFVSTIAAAELLVIDDLGSEFVTSFSQSVLYNIINDRMMNDLDTIISTNLDTARLTTVYEQRISSRILCGYTALGFIGRDIRLEKRK
ncbi:MAG: ATP-binding protein [Angelakisella sp.]